MLSTALIPLQSDDYIMIGNAYLAHTMDQILRQIFSMHYISFKVQNYPEIYTIAAHNVLGVDTERINFLGSQLTSNEADMHTQLRMTQNPNQLFNIN